MKLTENSLHAKLYKFAYLTNDLSDNLCAYFWKMIFSIPVIMLSFPLNTLIYFFDKNAYKERVLPTIGLIILNIFLLALLFVLIMIFIISPMNGDFIPMIVFLSIASLITGMIFLFISNYKFKTPEIFEIISEKIKSTKENYCPRIEWKNKK